MGIADRRLKKAGLHKISHIEMKASLHKIGHTEMKADRHRISHIEGWNPVML